MENGNQITSSADHVTVAIITMLWFVSITENDKSHPLEYFYCCVVSRVEFELVGVPRFDLKES